MLVLSRSVEESIIINDNIKIKVVAVRGDKVRLGIDAPKDVPVHREEVYKAIQRERRRPTPVITDVDQSSSEDDPAVADPDRPQEKGCSGIVDRLKKMIGSEGT